MEKRSKRTFQRRTKRNFGAFMEGKKHSIKDPKVKFVASYRSRRCDFNQLSSFNPIYANFHSSFLHRQRKMERGLSLSVLSELSRKI